MFRLLCGQVSQVYWFYLFVTMLPQPAAQDCHLSVRVESALVPNGVSKVKVRRIPIQSAQLHFNPACMFAACIMGELQLMCLAHLL